MHPMRFGVSYYPEITEESQWHTDLSAMKNAGLEIVRIAEFAWSAIEPRESEYAFEWLDRFVDMTQTLGMTVVMCTPTATPPAWLTTQYPEVLVVRRDGSRHTHGGRRDVDLDSPIFRHYAQQIARIMGQRYANHPAVIGWQIDNELIGPEGEPPESHSIATTFQFRQYLKVVHGDLSTLNHRWGTRFWSQEYSDWGEITTPRNPRSTMGQVLDYSRYFSVSLRGFIQLQARALREVIDAKQWISHNATAIFDRGIDHIQMAEPLDVAGWDAYPGAAGRPHPHAFAAMAHDMFRAAKQKPFWVLETSPIRDNVPDAHFAQMYARGAEAALMWHWREHPANAENDSDVFCDYAGRPDPARLTRLKSIQSRLDQIAAFGDTPQRERPRVGLVFCPDAVRVHLTPDPYMRNALSKRVSYLRILVETYRVLWRSGVAVDVIRPDDAFDPYQMLVLPSARLLSRPACQRISTFVERGGTLLGVAKTAHQDEWATFYPSPGELLAEALGFAMTKHLNLPGDAVLQAEWGNDAIDCLPIAERVEPTRAQVLARFTTEGLLKGAPAALWSRFGAGTSFYAAACSEELIQRLLPLASAHAGVKCWAPVGSDIGLLPSTPDLMWVFNYQDQPCDIAGVCVAPGDFARVPAASFQSLAP